MEQGTIDFVITWVDGNDPKWIKERNSYYNIENGNTDVDNSESRFRDWDNLQYWFRGVENFAPWVNNIYFVTWGHIPNWLNINHPKLKIVRHEDFIPHEYLPTFSSHAIEANLHRIKGLSENFVYFNDDTFLINNVKKEDFFKENLPCDSAVMNVHCYNDEMFVLSPFRDVGVVNKYFNMRNVLKNNVLGWFNFKYGLKMLRNLYLLPCPRFPGFLQQHLPNSFKKSTFEELWDKEPKLLEEASEHKFRTIQDVNQWVFKEWQLASNKFYPRRFNIGKSIPAYNLDQACAYITKQKGKMLCFNDSEMNNEKFMSSKVKLNQAFKKILPNKSSYER